MKIGLLSDTHGYLDGKIQSYFADCDEIWHAGDIGDSVLADQLAAMKPLKAVFGNIDTRELQKRFPEDLWFTCEGLQIWLTHIGGVPPHYNPRIKRILNEREQPDIFICGHSHILRVMKDPNRKDMLYINPGAAGNHGFHHMKTLITFEVHSRNITNMQVIELGKRGSLT